MTEIDKAIAYWEEFRQEAIFMISNYEDINGILSEQAEICDITLSALREQAERNNPKPLTIEQLRERSGKPVWTVGVSFTDDGSYSMWDIIESVDDDGVEFGYSSESVEWWNYNLCGSDGELLGCAWVAYDHEPKDVRG